MRQAILRKDCQIPETDPVRPPGYGKDLLLLAQWHLYHVLVCCVDVHLQLH
jgi:hypothetical protein